MKIKKLLSDAFWRVYYSFYYLLMQILYFRYAKPIEKHKFSRNIESYQVALAGMVDAESENIKSCLIDNVKNVIFHYSKNDKEIASLGGNFFINIRNKESFILEFNNIKIGYICVDDRGDNLHNSVLKKYINMKKKKTDIVYLYLVNMAVSPSVLKKLAHIGYEAIININDTKKTAESGGYKSIGKTRIYNYLDGRQNIDGNVVSYNAAIYHRYNKSVSDWAISQQGFEILTFNGVHNEKLVSRLECVFADLPHLNDRICVRQLSKAIGLEIPSKLNYLLDYSVVNVCARVAEVGPNSIFFFRQPLKHNNDRWRFLDLFYFRMPILSYMKGAMLVVSYKKLPKYIPHIVVEDCIEEHIKTIDWCRKRKNSSVKTICITGSIGKTTTKDMLFSVLSNAFDTGKSELNTNVQAKIGINMQRLRRDVEVFIQEVGGGRPGGASKHARMVSPDIAVITNIGTAHIGNFNSQEELMLNKLGITEGLAPNGVLFLNGDDKLLVKAKTSFKQIYFSVYNRDADYYADNIKEYGDYMTFDIVSKGEIVGAKLNISGIHNVLNAVCCFAIGKTLGMENHQIVKGIGEFKTADCRQNVIKIGDLRIIADCYNASYESVVSSLELLKQVECSKPTGKKIAVLGNITGLGKEKKGIYLKLSEHIRNCGIENIVFYTDEDSEIIEMFKNKVILMQSSKQLLSWLDANYEKEDVILFKGSSKAMLDEIIDSFLGLDISDTRYYEESKSVNVNDEQFSYSVFENYASVTDYYGKDAEVKMSSNIYGKIIKKVKSKAFFENNDVESIYLPSKAVHIGEEAFSGCNDLKNVYNLECVRNVGKRAFYRNYSLKKIEFGEELLVISEEAFAECRSLKELIIPKSVLYIGKDAFKNCSYLEEVSIEGDPLIEEGAFDGCDNIKIMQ